MMTTFNSLAFRLFASAAAWTLVVLPIAAFVLISLYEDAVERSFDARLNLYLTTLIANTSSDEDKLFDPPPILNDPIFDLPLSGWYWQIKRMKSKARPEFVSRSLLDSVIPLPSENNIQPDNNLIRRTYLEGPQKQSLRIIEREITFGEGAQSKVYSFAVAGDSTEIIEEIWDFTSMLAITLGVLGIGLVLATIFQVRFGLRPLRAIRRDLADIRSGKATRLEGELPLEIKPLQNELNELVRSNQDIIERARTHVGNLAHALKTPLSVITNEAASKKDEFAHRVSGQAQIMRDQITHHLDRARMVARSNITGGVTEVEPVIEPLIRALSRIYKERNIEIKADIVPGALFLGEKHDLEEMIGNLMDNACKWATSRVSLSVEKQELKTDDPHNVLIFIIDDDGPGLSDEQKKIAMKRGRRLDETKPGSGLGLSIVADLAGLYKGRFTLENADKSGLKVRLVLPSA